MPGVAVKQSWCQSGPKRSGCCGAEEVYAPLSGVETGDLTKRGGRHTPEFIWNVKWQDQVHEQPCIPVSQAGGATVECTLSQPNSAATRCNNHSLTHDLHPAAHTYQATSALLIKACSAVSCN